MAASKTAHQPASTTRAACASGAGEETAPALSAAERAQQAGDFERLGDLLRALPEPDAHSPRAQQLANATRVDPAHVGLIALCTLALIAIALRYLP